MSYMKVKMKCKKSSGKSGTHAVYKKKERWQTRQKGRMY
jgi:hypothetical protein